MPPLVLLTAAFGLGVALAYKGEFVAPLGCLAIAFIFLVGAVLAYWRGRRETPVFLLLCFGFLGYTWAGLNEITLPPDLEPFLGHYVKLQGTLKDRPVFYPNRIVFILKEPTVRLNRETWHGSFKIQAVYYLPTGSNDREQRETDRVKMLLPGDEISVKGRLDLPPEAVNPGDFDYRQYLAHRGIVAQLKASGSPFVLHVNRGSAGDFLPRIFTLVRLRVEEGIKKSLPPVQASFLNGVLLGAKEEITPEDREVYLRAGVMHLFAVSGLHVGFLLSFFLILARFLRLSRGPTFVLITFGLLGYAALVGLPPSVIRAAVMGIVGVGAYLWQQQKNTLTAFALAAFVVLVFNPWALLEPGFQLSFAATWGIITLSGPLGAYVPLRPGWKEIITVPLVAQLAVLPLTALYFQLIPCLGFLANILVVPLAGLIVNLGAAGMIFSFFHPVLGSPFYLTVGALILPVRSLLSYFAGVPGNVFFVSTPPWWITVSWYVFLYLLSWSKRAGSEIHFPHFRFRPPASHWLLPSLTGLALLAILIFAGVRGNSSLLRVTFLSVGQGDAILVEVPNGRKMLVDGGGKPAFSQPPFDPGRQIVVPYLARQGIRYLDLVVNSHPHEDHLGGLVAVVQNIQVGKVVTPPVEHPTPLWQEFNSLLTAKKVPIYKSRKGTFLQLDPRVKISVVHPPGHLLTGTRSDLNNNSLILHIRYGKVSFLLTGDVEREAMAYLAEVLRKNGAGQNEVRATVLKAPHHGSATSIDLEFAELVRPQVVVISVGPNPFGHPSPEALKFWQERGVRLLPTDEEGALTFETDGNRLFLRTGHRTKILITEAGSDFKIVRREV